MATPCLWWQSILVAELVSQVEVGSEEHRMQGMAVSLFQHLKGPKLRQNEEIVTSV